MADPERFLRFVHRYRDGLHCYVARADGADMPGPVWPGLWEKAYPDDPDLNPWRRHAINNSDGEALAVWRALAWGLTADRSRFALPAYYRDEAAHLLGVDREAVQLVRWEYAPHARRRSDYCPLMGVTPRSGAAIPSARPCRADHRPIRYRIRGPRCLQ